MYMYMAVTQEPNLTDTAFKADMISLDTDEGQRLLSECTIYQDILMDMFDYQQHISHCGIQSCALLLASYEGGKACRAAGHKDFQHYNTIKEQFHGYAMFSHKETLDAITDEVIRKQGTSLADVQQILHKHGHQAVIYFQSDSSVEEFRRIAMEALSLKDSSMGVIVNYQRYLIGQIGKMRRFGHHSPLCAYHQGTDRFLVMDTNVVSPRMWLKTEDLFQAMRGLDQATGKSRGYIVMGGHRNYRENPCN